MRFSARLELHLQGEAIEGVENSLFGQKIKKDRGSETFELPSLIDGIHSALNVVDIDSVLRLYHNDMELYRDTEGNKGDLRKVLVNFGSHLALSEYTKSDIITLLFEKYWDDFYYLIEITINRIHKKDVVSVVIVIDALTCRYSGDLLAEGDFTRFVTSIEEALKRYIDSVPVKIKSSYDYPSTRSSSAKPANLVKAKNKNRDKKSESDEGSVDISRLFPLFEVTLGETTVETLKKLGRRSTMKDNRGKLYKYYVLKGINFWYSNDVADRMYLVKNDPLPDIWRKLGFDWELSYSDWQTLFKRAGCDISIIKEPKNIRHFSGKYNSLEAEFEAYWLLDNHTFNLRLNFNYSNKLTVTDRGSLYAITVTV